MNNARLIQFAIKNGYCGFEAALLEQDIKEHNKLKDQMRDPSFKEEHTPHTLYQFSEMLLSQREMIDLRISEIRQFLRRKGFRNF